MGEIRVWNWERDTWPPPVPWLEMHPYGIADLLSGGEAVDLFERMFPGITLVPSQRASETPR